MITIYNYSHEIPVPDSRAMRKFLWSDYFHDSFISDIAFVDTPAKLYPSKNTVIFKIHCDRDCVNAFKISHDKISPHVYWTKILSDKYVYFLSFYNVEYFETQCEPYSMVYLNGRFKDTKTVSKLNSSAKNPYYHFRMQVTGGYIDIVFNKFKIRKSEGRVNYSTDGYSFERKVKPLSPQERKEIFERFYNGAFDDFNSFFDMQRLYNTNDSGLLKYARDCIKSNIPIEDAKPYAAYLLGKIGEKSDLPLIKELYFQTEDRLQRIHIKDAIDSLSNDI